MTTTWSDVLSWRLERSGLGERSGSLTDVAERLVGVQAQLMSSAEIALSLRGAGVAPATVEQALWIDRSLIKSWTARGTLHLVTPADLALWCGVMSARGQYWAKPAWERYHGVTAAEMERVLAAIAEELPGRCLTRAELAEHIGKASGLPRLAAQLMGSWGGAVKPPAYHGLLCFGPSNGRNITFVAPRDWIGADWEPAEPDDALAQVALRYVDTYGPSTRADLARWMGVEAKLARRAFDSINDQLVPIELDGETRFSTEASIDELAKKRPKDRVRLLPAFDPYVVGVLEHLERLLPDPKLRPKVSRVAGWITPTVVVDGRIVGVWRYQRTTGGIEMTVEHFVRPTRALRAAVDQQVEGMRNLLARLPEDPDQIEDE
jgi:hypothetical protein